MSYQALLFSADEKASRVVSQILNELEFHVEVCNEPFAAVKRITNQHYDALVVDCDNEPNATLLFKSARNSSSNSDSLAVALVQGQGGIAKAFRIGANLVLTKPIHAEQSKGTLRTAKGLLRKAEAAKSTSAAIATLKVVASSLPVEPALPALSANAGFSVGPVASAAFELQEEQFPELGPEEAALLESMPEPVPMQLAAAAGGLLGNAGQTAAQPSGETTSVQMSSGGAATAAAPAKAATPPASEAPNGTIAQGREVPPAAEKRSTHGSKSDRQEAFVNSSVVDGPVPSSGQKSADANQAEEAGSRKNFLIAAVLVLASAAAIYYAWPQLEPLLTGIPIVQKYLVPQQAASPSVVAAPVRPAAHPATSTQSQPAASPTPAPPADTLATSGSSPAAAASASSSEKIGSSAPSASSPDSASPAQRPLHLAPDAAAGLLLQKVDPVYPPSALQQHVEGSVELQANIGKDGTPAKVKVLSGQPVLAKAAVAAVRQWKYTPYVLNGEPAEVQTEITVDFKLP